MLAFMAQLFYIIKNMLAFMAQLFLYPFISYQKQPYINNK